MKKFELIPASRATRNGTNKTSSSGDENVPCYTNTAVKRYARAQFPCNSRQNSPYKVLNFPKTFALKPKFNAVPGKLRFIHRLWMGNLIIDLH